MSTIKNYRNYLPMLGLIITGVFTRIWDSNDYVTNFGGFFIYIILVNPIVFAFLSILLNAIKYKSNQTYTESTFAILIQLILYFCCLMSADDIGAMILTAYFAYIVLIDFTVMLIVYLIEKHKKQKPNS